MTNYTYIPPVNCSCTEYNPFWSGNYTAYNKIWSSTYNQTYDAALNRNITDEVIKAINESGIAACNDLISWDLNKAWMNTLGGGNITERTISSSLLSPGFGISSRNITSWDSNIEATGAYYNSGYIIKPYSGVNQPFECVAVSEGWMFYNTSSHTLMICDGMIWRNVLLE